MRRSPGSVSVKSDAAKNFSSGSFQTPPLETGASEPQNLKDNSTGNWCFLRSANKLRGKVSFMRQRGSPDLSMEVSATHLAALLHTNAQAIIRLTEAGIIRRGTDLQGRPVIGSYRLDQALGDWADYMKKEALGRGRHAFEEARAHNLQLKNAAAELRLKQTDGSLIPMATLLEIVGSMCLRFRTKLQSVLPRIIRTAYHAPSSEEALRRGEEMLGEILAELGSLKKSDLERRQKEKETQPQPAPLRLGAQPPASDEFAPQYGSLNVGFGRRPPPSDPLI